jgi:hypothetical protein
VTDREAARRADAFGHSAVPEVQVGAADRRARHAHDRVGFVRELRVRRGFVTDVVLAVVDDGFHG